MRLNVRFNLQAASISVHFDFFFLRLSQKKGQKKKAKKRLNNSALNNVGILGNIVPSHVAAVPERLWDTVALDFAASDPLPFVKVFVYSVLEEEEAGRKGAASKGGRYDHG